MTIDQFTRKEFESYLEQHKPYEPLGLIQGEYCYKIILDGQVSIMIRSSINADGVAGDTGKNSIRLWLVDNHLKPIGSKIDKWTTRIGGWQSRLDDKIYQLAVMRSKAGDCPECQKPFGIYKRKSDKELFVKCFSCKERTGRNVNGNLNNDGRFSTASRQSTDMSTKPLETAKTPNDAETGDLGAFLANPFGDEGETKNQPANNDFSPNDKQKLAIEKPVNSNVLVLAGPGAGKTFVIKHRVNYLVKNGVNPNGILVITYSKAMADEMNNRIISLTPNVVKNQISTIHAFCYRELTRNNPELRFYGWQVPGKHSPIKSWQIRQKIDDLVKEIWPKHSEQKPGHKEILEWIDTSKYYGATGATMREWFTKNLGAFYGGLLTQIRARFDKWLYAHKCMTFNDMLYLMEQELISNPEFKQKLQQKYSNLVVDEGQDTNYQAFKILFHILDGNANLFIVGDVNQMMYRFQGAKPELITNELGERFSDLETVILDKNYRSKNEIVSAFQKLIAYNYTDLRGPYDQDLFQYISGVNGNGGSVTFNMESDIFEESAKAAEAVKNLIATGEYDYSDIFIGARTKAQLGYIEAELFKSGVKFINIAGGSFWNNLHVRNVISYLKLAHNTSDSEALKNVVNIASNNNCYTWSDKNGKFEAGDYCPVRYLGEKFLQKINYDFNNIDRFLMTAKDAWRYKTNDRAYDIYGPTKAQDLQEFVWSLQESALQSDNVGQLVQMIIDDCYEKYLQTTEGSANDDESNLLDNLMTVVDLASQHERIEDFLAYVEELQKAAEDTKDKNWNDYTVISTYHRLKGLERKIIFGTGWCEGVNTKTGEPSGLLPHTFSLTSPPQFGVLPAGSMSPVEDERCIAFVCISRAKDHVYLSGCERYRNSKMQPSRFVNEIGL